MTDRQRVERLKTDLAVARLERSFWRRVVRCGHLGASLDHVEIANGASCEPLVTATNRIAELEQRLLQACAA